MPSDLLLDACVELNLVASGVELAELAGAVYARFVMTSVVASETPWVNPLDASQPRERIDSDGLAARGISFVMLDPDESERFVELARDIEDGEAATLAVAVHRGLRVATDDRKAIRLAASLSPPVKVLRTSDLLKHWAEDPQVDDARAGLAVRWTEVRASFVPPSNDPNLEWWNAVIAT